MPHNEAVRETNKAQRDIKKRIIQDEREEIPEFIEDFNPKSIKELRDMSSPNRDDAIRSFQEMNDEINKELMEEKIKKESKVKEGSKDDSLLKMLIKEHPEWSDDQILDEIESIKKEQQMMKESKDLRI